VLFSYDCFPGNNGTEEQIGQVDDSIEVSLQMTLAPWGQYIFPFLPSGPPDPSAWIDELEEVRWKIRRLLNNECTKRSRLYFKTMTALLS